MNLTSLLGAILPLTVPSSYPELEPIINFLNEAIMPITVILAIAAGIFGVAIVFLLIKAESVEKSEEMKKRLIHIFITIACVIGALWLFAITLKNLDTILGQFKGK